MDFVVHSARFVFEAQDPIHFPQGKAANVLRGALGYALDEQIFRPRQTQGPSGLADPPRPFVFRVRHLEGRSFQPGDRFPIEMNLFDREVVAQVGAALAAIAAQGLGPGRGRASLTATETAVIPLALRPSGASVNKASVLFLTPTEIKAYNGQLTTKPGFDVLLARVRDRISTLRTLYGDGPLDIDFRAFAGRAAQVQMTSARLQHVRVDRTSTRTGQRHPLGGFTGEVTFEGDLGEFIPYLNAASYTGVGRQTVWGKGEIAVALLG
jgi:hypothetical protein